MTLRLAPKHRSGEGGQRGNMSRLVPHRPHAVLQDDDLAYVRRSYLPLDEVARKEGLGPDALRRWIEARQLPGPAYLLPDGTPMFPADLLALVRSAGGFDAVEQHFATRTEIAAQMAGIAPGTREEDWEDYLSGEYGICLRQVTPETLVVKEMLVERIGHALEHPTPGDPRWRRALAFQIDGLDALLRPFARVDRMRFGRPTSRERLVEAPRRRWPWLAGGAPADQPATRALCARNSASVRTPMPVAPLAMYPRSRGA